MTLQTSLLVSSLSIPSPFHRWCWRGARTHRWTKLYSTKGEDIDDAEGYTAAQHSYDNTPIRQLTHTTTHPYTTTQKTKFLLNNAMLLAMLSECKTCLLVLLDHTSAFNIVGCWSRAVRCIGWPVAHSMTAKIGPWLVTSPTEKIGLLWCPVAIQQVATARCI